MNAQSPNEKHTKVDPISLDSIIKLYKKPSSQYIMVIAHRADWRSFPENSTEAIRSAIDLGVDMVEIDIRKTKDDSLVLMHDKSINRTTNGSGQISELSFEEIQLLYLKTNTGELTDFKIPTLREALLTCKGKIMINLDKAHNYIDEIYPILKETQTIHQVILKGHFTSKEFKSKYKDLSQELIYMPVINDKTKDVKKYIIAFESLLNPTTYEVNFMSKNSKSFKQISELKKNGNNIWMNTLWASLANGKTDNKAKRNPDKNYGWLVNQGANMIQTDRPKELIEYLKSIGKR